MDFEGLRRLGRLAAWRRWTLASFLARLPVTMTLLALVLAGHEATGSLAIGAQLAGVATVVTGLAAPWRGRRLDARELRGGVQRACAAAAVVLFAQAVAVGTGMPLAVLFALAAAQGVTLAAVSGGYRALLAAVVPRADLARANAVEAVFVEVAFVSGPALAGMLAFAVGAVGVLVAMGAAAAASVLAAAGLPRMEPPEERVAAAPWRAPGVWPVYAIAFALGVAVGLFESALPARVSDLGYAAASAGPLLALLAGGSGVGGVVATLRNDGARRPRLQAVVLLAAFGLLLVPAALSGSVLLLGAALFVAGVPIAPLNALGAMLLQESVPAGRQAEGFAVYIAAILFGAGAGQIVTGLVLDRVGPQALLLGCAAIPVLLALVVAQRGVRARRLRAAASS